MNFVRFFDSFIFQGNLGRLVSGSAFESDPDRVKKGFIITIRKPLGMLKRNLLINAALP